MASAVAALVVSLWLGTACNTVSSAPVDPGDVVARGTPVAVINANSVGVTALFHIVTIVPGGDLDTVVKKVLVSEAKAQGGNRVQIVDAISTPRQGLFALAGGIVGLPVSMASGVAVK